MGWFPWKDQILHRTGVSFSKHQYLLMQPYLLLLIVSVLTLKGFCQILWTGPMITFVKADYADWTLPENQDRITDNVWITRADNQGLFNAAAEVEYDRIDRDSPEGTEWALGSISDGIANLNFTTWHLTNTNSSHEQEGINKVLHLIADDIYIDIKILAWTQGGGGSGTGMGGGFSYERSTDPLGGLAEPKENQVLLYPNPSNGILQIQGLTSTTGYRVYNLIGQEAAGGKTGVGGTLELDLAEGSYVLKLESGLALPLIIRY